MKKAPKPDPDDQQAKSEALRRLLWLNHQCHIVVRDGDEMRCAAEHLNGDDHAIGPLDFKRDDLHRLVSAICSMLRYEARRAAYWETESQRLVQWKASALQQLAKSEALHQILSQRVEYLGWDVYDAAVDALASLNTERAAAAAELTRLNAEFDALLTKAKVTETALDELAAVKAALVDARDVSVEDLAEAVRQLTALRNRAESALLTCTTALNRTRAKLRVHCGFCGANLTADPTSWTEREQVFCSQAHAAQYWQWQDLQAAGAGH